MPVSSEHSTSTGTPAIASIQPDERRRFFDFQRQMQGLLVIVRSLVRRMAESSASVEDFAAHLEGRLGALARMQGFLSRAPDAPVNLEELVRAELLAQSIPDAQFEIQGPRILLTAKEAGTLALALHELRSEPIANTDTTLLQAVVEASTKDEVSMKLLLEDIREDGSVESADSLLAEHEAE